MTRTIDMRISDRYRLVNGHPASKYGLPVVIDDDGRAYGADSLLPSDRLPPVLRAVFTRTGRKTTSTFRAVVQSWADRPERTAEEVAAAKLFIGY